MTSDEPGWRYGTRRRGDELVIRDLWQGLFGPNAWLTILLGAGGFMVPMWWNVACWMAVPLVAARFHPFVRFGPESVRWRNWFRVRQIPIEAVERLDVTNDNHRSWVPVVTATADRSRAGRSSARFVSTMSYRRAKADVVAAEIRRWADGHSIEHDLRPGLMTWSLAPPSEDGRDDRAARVRRRRRNLLAALPIVLGAVFAAHRVLRTAFEPRADVAPWTSFDMPRFDIGPSGADAGVWDAVGGSGRQPVVVTADWATGRLDVVDTSSSPTDWTYALRWSEADGRSSTLRVSSPDPDTPQPNASQRAEQLVWSSGKQGDERALVMVERSTCSPDEAVPRSVRLVLTDEIGDVVGDIVLAAGDSDPCRGSAHAVSDETLVDVLRSLMICTSTGPDARRSASCAPLPIDAATIRAGAAVLFDD